jgi:uncharacterized protein (DUF433 family)
MGNADRIKAWAARKRDRAPAQPTTTTTTHPKTPPSPSPVVAPAVSRDEALRDRAYLLVEPRNGRLCPRGSSVSVKQVAYLHGVARKTPVEIVARCAGRLTLAQCHAALAYYFLHKAEVDAELARDGELNAPGVLSDTGVGRLPRVGLRALAGLATKG